MRNLLALIVIGVLAAACASSGGSTAPRTLEEMTQRMVGRSPSPAALPVCHGYGCGWRTEVTLSEMDWRALRQDFDVPAPTAQAERERIAQAIGQIEQTVGRHTGTSTDRARTQFRLFEDATQLDCIDESINTTTYLHLLARHGLLHFHRVGELRRRTRFLFFGQHYTAVVEENESGRAFAIDSWFHANGRAAEIVELDRWMEGWEPVAK